MGFLPTCARACSPTDFYRTAYRQQKEECRTYKAFYLESNQAEQDQHMRLQIVARAVHRPM
jgi:hypothetical protein